MSQHIVQNNPIEPMTQKKHSHNFWCGITRKKLSYPIAIQATSEPPMVCWCKASQPQYGLWPASQQLCCLPQIFGLWSDCVMQGIGFWLHTMWYSCSIKRWQAQSTSKEDTLKSGHRDTLVLRTHSQEGTPSLCLRNPHLAPKTSLHPIKRQKYTTSFFIWNVGFMWDIVCCEILCGINVGLYV